MRARAILSVSRAPVSAVQRCTRAMRPTSSSTIEVTRLSSNTAPRLMRLISQPSRYSFSVISTWPAISRSMTLRVRWPAESYT